MNSVFIKFITAAIVVVMLFSGCSLFRSKNSKREFTYNKSSDKEFFKRDSVNVKVDQTVIKETESADTSVYTKGSKVVTSKFGGLEALLKGLVAVDSGLVRVKVTLDSATNKVTTEVYIKPERVDLKFHRFKETQVNKTESTNVNTEKKKEVVTEAKKRSRETDSKPSNIPWIWIAAISIIIVLIFLFRKKPK